MSEFEDTLNKLLSSPEEMEKIMGLAKSLSAGMGTAQPSAASEPPRESDASEPQPSSDGGVLPDFLNPKTLGLITRLMGAYQSGGSDKAELFRALRPYLKESERGKLDRASEISKLARLAKIAMSEFSEGGGA
jgi:hypothetical protein